MPSYGSRWAAESSSAIFSRGASCASNVSAVGAVQPVKLTNSKGDVPHMGLKAGGVTAHELLRGSHVAIGARQCVRKDGRRLAAESERGRTLMVRRREEGRARTHVERRPKLEVAFAALRLLGNAQDALGEAARGGRVERRRHRAGSTDAWAHADEVGHHRHAGVCPRGAHVEHAHAELDQHRVNLSEGRECTVMIETVHVFLKAVGRDARRLHLEPRIRQRLGRSRV